MSDFYSVFWDYYIAIISIVSVIGCGVFLWMQSKRTVKVTLNAQGEPQTTGHVWDGDLQEFHNPMPRWWIWLFYLTVLFSVIYLVLYPGLGTQWQGVLKWTQSGQYQAEVKAADARFGPIFAAYAAQPIETVSVGPLETGQTASASGTFELCAPGLADQPLLGSLLWRVEFDEATGARARRYVKASPRLAIAAP